MTTTAVEWALILEVAKVADEEETGEMESIDNVVEMGVAAEMTVLGVATTDKVTVGGMGVVVVVETGETEGVK